MRLLIISSEFPPGPGGIGNHAHQLALNLHRLGWDVAVLSPQDYVSKEQAEKFNSEQPFKVFSMPSGRGRFREAFHRLRIANRLARECRPDVVVGTGLSGVWVTAALAAVRRLPLLVVAHGSEFGSGHRMFGKLNRLAFQRAAVVVAVSEFTRGVMAKVGIHPRHVEVITNAADHGRFMVLPDVACQAFRKAEGFNGGPLLLTVGHVSERKGQEVVIRALPEIVRKMPDTQYVMVGLPTLQGPLTRLAEQLGVRNHVHFRGGVANDAIVRWLNCADVFVMTSRTTSTGDCEGFGIAVVEAALCGKPAIVSRQSGLIEAIEEDVTGLAVPENDERATATAIVSLLSDAGRRTAMGTAAQTRARRDQTWETCARKYDVLLRQTISRESAPISAFWFPISAFQNDSCPSNMSLTYHSTAAASNHAERPLPLDDIIGWDVGNWSKCLSYWQPWLSAINKNTGKVLMLGERNGGISLWFALLGFEVLCTDYSPLEERVRKLHQRWQVEGRITYGSADVFNLAYPDDHFDVVACKSVIGGLALDYKDASTRTPENQKKAVEEIRRVLKPGGVFLGAENLTGTDVHMALRRRRLKGRLGWRYLRVSEVRRLFEGYSACEQKPYGFLGTHWSKFRGLKSLCATFDIGFSKILPPDWLYISFIRARK